MKSHKLVFRAGPGAFDSIRKHGFSPERIGTLAGASGGAKWLVLSQIDRVVLASILPKLRGVVHLIGSSIGAWRFSCYAQSDPVAAIERFEEAYIEQSYSEQPDRAEITAKSREILRTVFAGDAVEQILQHPTLRTHVMTVRARHIAASDNRYLLGAGLIAAAAMNTMSRQTLGLFFERALFFDPRALPPFYEIDGFPLQRVPLAINNLEDVVVATGSIPMVLDGVRDIAGARRGVYRDGGIIDYHLDFPHSEPDRLTLYPHFFDRIVPGWFDKKLAWRKPAAAHIDRTILVSPSAEFAANLPGGKVPDRTDFRRYGQAGRVDLWRRVVAECKALADELYEVIETDRLAARLQPL